MLLYFHKDRLGNFGDDLNPWLWPRVFPGLLSGEVHHDPRVRAPFDAAATLFVGIGTLLNTHVPQSNRKLVFGSGIGYGTMPRIDERWDFACVRGPLTAQRLGLADELAIVDPAVLAADYAPPPSSARQASAYMPHCASVRHADWAELCDEAGLRFIDPRWPVDRVLAELRATSTLITEALHGAILAEALRIPWAAARSSPTVLDFKWRDWCASIARRYEPEVLPTLWRPSASVLGRMRFSLKRRSARHALKQLARSNHARLADEARFAELKARLLERVEYVRSAHPALDRAHA